MTIAENTTFHCATCQKKGYGAGPCASCDAITCYTCAQSETRTPLVNNFWFCPTCRQTTAPPTAYLSRHPDERTAWEWAHTMQPCDVCRTSVSRLESFQGKRNGKLCLFCETCFQFHNASFDGLTQAGKDTTDTLKAMGKSIEELLVQNMVSFERWSVFAVGPGATATGTGSGSCLAFATTGSSVSPPCPPVRAMDLD